MWQQGGVGTGKGPSRGSREGVWQNGSERLPAVTHAVGRGQLGVRERAAEPETGRGEHHPAFQSGTKEGVTRVTSPQFLTLSKTTGALSPVISAGPQALCLGLFGGRPLRSGHPI